MAYGGGWRTQIYIRNTSAVATTVMLYYFGDNGDLLRPAFGGVSSDYTSVTIPANGQQVVEPDWQAATTTGGWAALVYPNAGVKVQGVFLWQDAAGKYTQAVAPVVSQGGAACVIPMPSGNSPLTMPYDETEGQSSGYGFANTMASPVTLNLTFYDRNGVVVGQYSEELPAFGHRAFLLRDRLPSITGQQGTMVITAQGVVPLGFRFGPDNTFTTWLP
jgi:hypothetical protein